MRRKNHLDVNSVTKKNFGMKDLKRHHDSHGNIRPHECHICDAKFKRKNHLETHLKTIHRTADTSESDSTQTNEGDLETCISGVKIGDIAEKKETHK